MAAMDPDGNLHVVLSSSSQCFYREISGALHPNSQKVVMGDLKPIRRSPITVPLNQFEVTCFTRKKHRYIEKQINGSIAEGNSKPIKRRFKRSDQSKHGLKLDESIPFYRQPFIRVEPITDRSFSANSLRKLSVDILVLDSVSLSQFSRHMKRTLAFMKEQMRFLIFEKPGKVGDNTISNLITLLTGRRYYEPDHAKLDNLTSDYPTDRILKADTDFNFIWKKFSDNGYVTMLHTDPVLKGYGFLFYPSNILQGFTKPPADYYYRPFHQYCINKPIEKEKVKFCRGNFLYHDMVLELSRQWHRAYRDICHFSVTLALHDYTHDDRAHLELLDAPLFEHFKKLHKRNDLNNTIFILLGDHGNRLSPIKFSSQGQIEERMSFLAMYFPPWFKESYPLAFKNLQQNSGEFITHQDTYETLKDILNENFSGLKSKDSPLKSPGKISRGQSLFSQLSPERNCENQEIPKQFCLCLEQANDCKFNRTEVEAEIQKLLVEYFVPVVTVDIISLDVYSPNKFVRKNVRHFDLTTIAMLKGDSETPKLLFLRTVAKVKRGSRSLTVVAQALCAQNHRCRLTKVLYKNGRNFS